MFQWLADLVVLVHGAFIVFAVLGGLLVWWRPWIAWFHLPCAVYAAAIEFQGWICPLTPLENRLRRAGGGSGYEGGFIEHALEPLIYPSWLTRDTQVALGVGVLVINVLVYAAAFRRRRAEAA